MKLRARGWDEQLPDRDGRVRVYSIVAWARTLFLTGNGEGQEIDGEKSGAKAYIPYVAASVSEAAIQNLLNRYGKVVKIEINREKKIALAESTLWLPFRRPLLPIHTRLKMRISASVSNLPLSPVRVRLLRKLQSRAHQAQNKVLSWLRSLLSNRPRRSIIPANRLRKIAFPPSCATLELVFKLRHWLPVVLKTAMITSSLKTVAVLWPQSTIITALRLWIIVLLR